MGIWLRFRALVKDLLSAGWAVPKAKNADGGAAPWWSSMKPSRISVA